MSDVQMILRKVSNGEDIVISDSLVAGRLADCGLRLTEGHPSRHHARFSVLQNETQLEDLGSANGTFVNDQRIEGSVVLRPGDKVRFDVEEFVYHELGSETTDDDAQKTVVRKVGSVDIESSDVRDRPAWIDPGKQVAGGPKTEFIDAAAIKDMMLDQDRDGAEIPNDVDVPALVIASGAKAGLRVNLRANYERGEWTIGCDSDRDIVLNDQGISGVHAKLVQHGRRWKLADQMSANGTFVNGKRSNVSYLDDGDRVRFGPVECIFRIPAIWGTATRVTRVSKPASNAKKIVLAVIGFSVTLTILYVVFRVLW